MGPDDCFRVSWVYPSVVETVSQGVVGTAGVKYFEERRSLREDGPCGRIVPFGLFIADRACGE